METCWDCVSATLSDDTATGCDACVAKRERETRTRIEAETVAAIVAWLREPMNYSGSLTFEVAGAFAIAADAIERNDWKRGG